MKRIPMPKPRVFEIKVLLNEDEFNEFGQACAAADVKHSPNLRQLARDWVKRQKDSTAPRGRAEWPVAGQNMAMLLPGRSSPRLNFGMPRAHQRM